MKNCVQHWQFLLCPEPLVSMSRHTCVLKTLLQIGKKLYNNTRTTGTKQALKTQVVSMFRFFLRCSIFALPVVENPIGEVMLLHCSQSSIIRQPELHKMVLARYFNILLDLKKSIPLFLILIICSLRNGS